MTIMLIVVVIRFFLFVIECWIFGEWFLKN